MPLDDVLVKLSNECHRVSDHHWGSLSPENVIPSHPPETHDHAATANQTRHTHP